MCIISSADVKPYYESPLKAVNALDDIELSDVSKTLLPLVESTGIVTPLIVFEFSEPCDWGHLSIKEMVVEFFHIENFQDLLSCEDIMVAYYSDHIKNLENRRKEGLFFFENKIKEAKNAILIDNPYFEIPKPLVSIRTAIEIINQLGWCLMKAASMRNMPRFQTLLYLEANVNMKNANDWTPLMFASRDGSLSMVQMLLRNHADINVVNRDQRTALMMAATRGHFEIVRELADHGANLDLMDSLGNTALKEAELAHEDQIVNFLRERGAGIWHRCFCF